MARFDLTDGEWAIIAPLLPNKPLHDEFRQRRQHAGMMRRLACLPLVEAGEFSDRLRVLGIASAPHQG